MTIEKLCELYNLDELKTLCFSLRLERSGWDGLMKRDLARFVITECETLGIDLLAVVRRERPRATLPHSSLLPPVAEKQPFVSVTPQPLTKLLCQSCFAPLDLSKATSTVTCEYCNTQHWLNGSSPSSSSGYIPLNGDSPDLVSLQRAMLKQFNLEDIRHICFIMKGVAREFDYDDIEGGTLGTKCISLIQKAQRMGKVKDLLDVLRKYRENFNGD